MYLSILIAGFGGGATRGLVGFIKHQFSYKDAEFNFPYFIFMMVLSGLVGLMTALAIDKSSLTFMGFPYLSPAIAFIVGYAGGDFLENVYKIIAKKPSVYPKKDE